MTGTDKQPTWPARFTKIEHARAHRYGSWSGEPRGRTYVEGRCAETVSPVGLMGVSHQCSRKNGHGPAGLFCKTHDPVARKKKDAERRAKWDQEEAKRHAIWDAEALANKVADMAIEVFAQRASFDQLEKLTAKYAAAKTKAAL